MLSTNYSEKLIGIKDVIVTDIFNNESQIKICIKLPRRPHECPACGANTDTIHDYRTQTIKDTPIHNLRTFLIYKKRRYVCHCCGKRFYENTNFLPRYYRISSR